MFPTKNTSPSRLHRSVLVSVIALLVSSILLGCNLLPSEEPVIVIASPTPDETSDTGDTTEQSNVEPDTDTNDTADLTPESIESEQETDAATAETSSQGLLQQVQDRGRLICGTNADLPGFGFYDTVREEWQGFDADFCRVVAAAVLGDAEAVEFVGPLLATMSASRPFVVVLSMLCFATRQARLAAI